MRKGLPIIPFALGESLSNPSEQPVHHSEILFGFTGRHHQRRANANDLPGERTEQMDRTALVVAEVASFDACLGDFLCWRVPNGSALDAPDNPLAPNMRDGWQLAESEQAADRKSVV